MRKKTMRHMIITEMSYVVLSFLIKTKSLNAFLNNATDQKLWYYPDRSSPSNYLYLNTAFSWRETKEGYNYWSNLNDKYYASIGLILNNEYYASI